MISAVPYLHNGGGARLTEERQPYLNKQKARGRRFTHKHISNFLKTLLPHFNMHTVEFLSPGGSEPFIKNSYFVLYQFTLGFVILAGKN